MTRKLYLVLVVGMIVLLGWPAPAAAQRNRTVVGIMPVYDASTFQWGEEFSRQMTYMVFKQMQALPDVQPLLLNPGGLYNPLGDEWSLEYAREAHADLVLITTLLEPDHPRSGDPALRLSYRLLKVATGDSAPEGSMRVGMGKRDFLMGLDYGHAGFFSDASRAFEKQPFGKAAASMAQQTVSYVRSYLGTVPATGVAPSWSAGSCEISFVVAYPAKEARSKAYTVIVNDREETIGISDGTVRTRLSSGPVIVRVSVRDAPYKTPVQALYQANSYLDCSAPAQQLALEIASSGQAFLRWR